jgi:rhomboid protease GluP
MEIPGGLRRFLDAIGVNTTRLQWRLYQWEQKRAQRAEGGVLPTGLRWMQYRHKLCLKCGAVNDREAKRCRSCDHRLPGMLGYRLFRLLGVLSPEGASPVTMSFLMLIVGFFLLSIVAGGPSALREPGPQLLAAFGAWSPAWAAEPGQFWRVMGFGLCHIGLIHIGFNGFALFQVGPVIESEAGQKRMLTLVTVSQLTAALASQFWYANVLGNDRMVTAGASGWLFGLIGYGILHFHKLGGSALVLRNFFFQWAIYGVVFGMVVQANNAAHIGGLLGGVAMAALPGPGIVRGHNTADTAWTVAALASLAAWGVTLVFLVRSIITLWPG